MKSWSRYNTLFRSGRYGWHLHNALSGIMLELDEPHHGVVASLREGVAGAGAGAARGDEFVALLAEHGFLADPAEEKVKLMELRYRRSAACFGTSHLGLTICPTLACNFACAYCFEHSQADATVMDDRTIAALLAFIAGHEDARHLSVSWYGGEPTLAFDVIATLSERFIALFPDYADAGLVTNGYLLGQEKIERLDDLRITSVQITLDGDAATHDRRRRLRGGGATYERILGNVDRLMASDWKGRCALRVNVDKSNQAEYATLHRELLERYEGSDLRVYPGRVVTFEGHPYGRGCGLCAAEWDAFQLERYAADGIAPRGGFYPAAGAQDTCVATSHQGYVVGPGGELYKCWEDVGRQDRVVGSVHAEPYVTDPALQARYTIGTDPHDAAECLECKVFPVCGGGCVNKRLRALQLGEGDAEYCPSLKESLEARLDAYLDVWHTGQICRAVLGTGSAPSMEKGYRMVQPQKEAEAAADPLENLAEQE
jgi:uncharacterized protein